jgi:hypothetical protein
VIHNDGSWGLSECRNIGIKHSEGEVVAFVDDDVMLDSNWSCAILNAFKKLDGIIGATALLTHTGLMVEPTGYQQSWTG